MSEPATLIAIAAVFLLAGAVKGVIGLGLPTVSLGLLAAALDLRTAMALMIVPSFVTNVWQASAGGNGRAIVRRIWPFLLTTPSPTTPTPIPLASSTRSFPTCRP